MFRLNSGGFDTYEIWTGDGGYFVAYRAPYKDINGKRLWHCRVVHRTKRVPVQATAVSPVAGLLQIQRTRQFLNA